MRRRMDVNVVPDRLLPAALPVFEDDYSLPVRERFVAYERWIFHRDGGSATVS